MKYCLLCNRRLKNIREAKLLLCKNCLLEFKLINTDFKINNEYLFPNTCNVIFNYESKVKELIYRYKFRKELILAKVISSLILENLNIKNTYDYISPAPSHVLRLIRHGFLPVNHVCKIISKKTKIKYLPCLEKKLFPLYEQKSLRKKQRLMQKNNIYCNTKLNGKNILLFDDIITSGQTIVNSIYALNKCNAKKIDVLIFALA